MSATRLLSRKFASSRSLIVLVLLIFGAARWTASEAAVALAAEAPEVSAAPPTWMADAVWYQVFPTRFCNGSEENDPPGTTAWSAPWTELAPGESPPLRDRLFFRSYGGDIQGILGKLEEIKQGGVNTIYLNPVFSAPSEHKYDTADHRHIDDTLGVAGSLKQITGETADPETWQWSASDKLFLQLVEQAHEAKVRIVIDGVFNHVGRQFWAWRDVVENGEASAYADWFAIRDWGPPQQWEAWDRPNGEMPRFRRFGDGLHPEVEAYLFAAVRRWMDPNGDGDPSDGVDGWRLDVADKVPHGFWKRFRRVVKGMNAEACIVGEVWTDPSDWLDGTEFDAVTNYRRSAAVVAFMGGDRAMRATDFANRVEVLLGEQRWETAISQMNLLDSHDTPRLVNQLASVAARQDVPPLERPAEEYFRRQQLAAMLQFTLPGAPIIYNGDELGMYGGNDPYCRSPMWWPEASPPNAKPLPGMASHYRALAALRHLAPELRYGTLSFVLADDAEGMVAFTRRYEGCVTTVLLNTDEKAVMVKTDSADSRLKASDVVVVVGEVSFPESATSDAADTSEPVTVGSGTVTLGPLSGVVFRVKADGLAAEPEATRGGPGR